MTVTTTSMRPVLLALAAFLPATGCPRAVSPADATRELGQACSAGADCVSGYCVDGLCCDRACGGTDACDLPRSRGHCTARNLSDVCRDDSACPSGHCAAGHCCDSECADPLSSCTLPRAPGTCTPRQLGDPCTAPGECAAGFCVDGVCCNAACGGLCETCHAQGSPPGECHPVPANTDPDDDCVADPCTACSGRICAAATPGTDPHGDCGAGRACAFPAAFDGGTGAAACLVAPGGGCARNADCAAGGCLMGTCLDFQARSVVLTDSSTLVTQYTMVRVAQLPGGAMVLLREVSQVDLDTSEVLQLARLDGAEWRSQPLPGAGTFMEADLDTFGDVAVVVYGLRVSRDDDPALCRWGSGQAQADGCVVAAQWIGPEFELGAREQIVDPATLGPGMHLCRVRVDSDDDGSVLAALVFGDDRQRCYNADARTTLLFRRDTRRRTWSAVGGPVSTTSLVPLGIHLVDGAPVLVERSDDGTGRRIALRWVKGDTVVSDDIAENTVCNTPAGVYLANSAASGQQVFLAGSCVSNPHGWVIRWDAAAPEGQRFTVLQVGGLTDARAVVTLGGEGDRVRLAASYEDHIEYREENLAGGPSTGSLELARLYNGFNAYGSLRGDQRAGVPILGGVYTFITTDTIAALYPFVVLFSE